MPKKPVDKELCKKYTEKMRKLVGHLDTNPGPDHFSADRLLCELLTQLGYAEVVKQFGQLEKWYD